MPERVWTIDIVQSSNYESRFLNYSIWDTILTEKKMMAVAIFLFNQDVWEEQLQSFHYTENKSAVWLAEDICNLIM